MGLPLLIVGYVSAGEDAVAMIAPGWFLIGVGAFVAIVAALMGLPLRSKSVTNLGSEIRSTSSDKDWFAELVKESESISSQISRQEAIRAYGCSLTEDSRFTQGKTSMLRRLKSQDAEG